MNYRRHVVALAIAAGSAAVAYGLTTAATMQQTFGALESKTIDYRLNSSLEAGIDSTIALVMFDTASIRDLPYLTPFPRAVLADLVNTAAANGATAIGLDVYLDRQYPLLSERDSGDARLREAIRNAGNVVLVAPTQGSDSVRHFLPPDPYFADVAAAVASADLPTPMEVLRDGALAVRTQEGLIPGFALALFAVSRGLDVDSMMRASVESGRLRLDGLPSQYGVVPAQGAMPFPIRFIGPPTKPGEEVVTDSVVQEFGTFPAYPSSIISALGMLGTSEGVTSLLGGRVVLMGSAFHEGERFRNAFYEKQRDDAGRKGEIFGWIYGVEAHANALQNIIQGSYMTPVPRVVVLLLLLAVALGTTALTFWKGVKWGAVFGAVALAAVWVAALQLFDRSYTILPMISPALATIMAFTTSAAYVSIVEGREKRMLRGAFSKYVPPGVVEELVADPTKLRLGGEKRTISILFSDVAGFTSMSEVLAPETLLSVLNEYLDEMSDIVFEERGTLDKYIGDAVMALYGAPTAVPDHALHACRTALRMQDRLAQLNARWLAEGREWKPLHIRIGVNTGTPVVGNIGGERRFDYTALGDAVNLAARLEPACKSYGVRIMISHETRRLAGDAIVVRELDMLAVYGKAEPVAVYELLALAGTAFGDSELIDLYDRGLAAYRNRDFELALQYFNAALEIKENDGPSLLYRDRSEEYMLNPPPADWDFVERRQIK